MATDSNIRIQKRNTAAQDYRRDQGVLRRTISGIGLATANAIDWLTGWENNDRPRFFEFGVMGLMRGALYGGLAAIAVIGFAHIVTAAVPVFLASAAIGAVWYGVRDSELGLEQHQRSSKKRFSDWIAEKSGAVPGKEHEKILEKEEFSPHARSAKKQSASAVAEATTHEKKFTAAEDARRAHGSHLYR